MGWTDLSNVLLLFPSLALTRPCWLPGSNVVLVKSSPTLRYLLNCGYLTTKPAILSTHGEYFPDEVAEGMIRMQTATVVQNEVQVKQNISLAVHTSLETSVRYVSETVDEKIWHWDLLEPGKICFMAFFGVFGCHFHSAVLFPRVFGTAYDIYPPQTSA